jgi:hypothetical protein
MSGTTISLAKSFNRLTKPITITVRGNRRGLFPGATVFNVTASAWRRVYCNGPVFALQKRGNSHREVFLRFYPYYPCDKVVLIRVPAALRGYFKEDL